MRQTIKFNILCFSLLLLFDQNFAQSQTEQDDYLKAKEYYNQGEFVFAMDYFRKLAGTNNNLPFNEYSSFYYALSAYKNGDTAIAKSMWLQMASKNKKWDNIDEVYHWLAQVYFEETDYSKGILYAKKSKIEASKGLMSAKLSEIERISLLDTLYQSYPNEEIIATLLADKIIAQPLSKRDFALLDQLISKFDLDKSDYGMPEIGESRIKSNYKIAVLLPFMFESLESTRRVERNKFVMGLYQGILDAAKKLNDEEQRPYLQIFPYDTKRTAEETAAILRQPELLAMDLIIGPLFPDPSKVANDFSFKNKINIINPLITNIDGIENNPYSFLFKSDTETQALAAAQVAIDSVQNKYAMVFYENNERDSLSAYTYSQRIQEAGFHVLMTAGVVDSTVSRAYNMLTDKYELVYRKDKLDSIKALDEKHFIKERKSIKVKGEIEYYEEFFTIAPDSIGHIYVASSKALFASNFISAISIRNDSTQIFGNAKWRKVQTLTFEEMERLGIYFIDPEYVDDQTEIFSEYRTKYISSYKNDPSTTAIIGYETMYYLGSMLKQYGTYFQKGNPTVGFMKGQLMYGTEFGRRNYNQYVPITKFSDSKLIVVNPK